MVLDSDQIVLGTAKIGMPYGIDGNTLSIANGDAHAILEYAESRGIELLDTSPAYGDAESSLAPHRSFGVITKVQKVESDRVGSRELAKLSRAFEVSLEKTARRTFYGLLVHDPADLYKPGAELILEWMQNLKAAGLVRKIGVSVYDAKDAYKLYESFPFDLVQLPVNIMNQNFDQSGVLGMLSSNGVEVHARSLFLKGALLKERLIATAVSKELRQWHAGYTNYLVQMGCSMLDACKLFAAKQSTVDKWVLGVNSKNQLDEILGPVEYNGDGLDFEAWASADVRVIDPRFWG